MKMRISAPDSVMPETGYSVQNKEGEDPCHSISSATKIKDLLPHLSTPAAEQPSLGMTIEVCVYAGMESGE